jgi:glucose/arabinose dehydrogenase/chitodextrinase
MGMRAFVSGSVAVAAFAAGVLVSTPAPAAADTFVDGGFVTEVVATVEPFSLVGLAFAPDGRMFVWQKDGVVRIIRNGVLLPTPFIDLSAKVNTYDDRGFWGLAFDPDFATNGFVYMSYTFEEGGNPNDSGPKTSRLTRVRADPANPDRALAGSETVIMGSIGTPPCSAHPAGSDCIAADSGSHSIGNLVFLPDGTLLVGNGDGADAAFADSRSLRAQDLNSTNGKILRINRDGTAPADNPFYDGTNSARSKVWLYGVRNPFRFAVQPGTGDIWFGDVGWNTWEEVNDGTRGANYGWPCFEGTGRTPGYQSFSQCATLSNSAVTAPYHTYDHSSTGTAVIGGPFYSGTLYPAQYRGNYFFADYTGNFIKRVVFDEANNPVSVETFATNVPSPVSLEQGPDGMIYYLSFTTGQIRRIRPNGPSASASATPTSGYSPLQVTFSSAGSTNPGGGSLTYRWDFGDGTTSTQANPTHTYTATGVRTFLAQLTVTDFSGASSVATVTITVGSTPPTPTIAQPADGTPVEPGQTVTFQGSASDPEDGQVPASALSWTVLLHHNSHVHTFVGGTGASGSFVVENHGAIGMYSYEIILTATDSSGLTASRHVNLPVVADTVPPSAPSGLTATPGGGGQINLAWNPSADDNAVAAYRVERCQGANCTNFVEVGTSTVAAFSDSGLAASTTYRYRVRAADTQLNLGDYSNVASATTSATPPPPTGLVAGYSFDAGSGSSVADVSGNGNTGAITAATWVSGKYGGALSFNGTNARVSVPASTSLNVTSAMTLMAWVQPTASQSGWRTIMQREPDAYVLNASNANGPLRPSGGGTLGGSFQWVSGPTASPVNAWTHVALTYDGSVLRLYVNGTQVATTPAAGSIDTTTNPLWIGGNSPYGEYFQGLIDEARVYDRALNATEVQAAMNTPLVPPAPDTVPPSAPSGLTATAASPTQVNLSWTAATDNVAVAGYRVERCQGAGCTDFAEVGTSTGTTFNNTGLTAGTSYSYRVRAVDTSDNTGGASNTATVATPAPDTTPPSAPSGLTATPGGGNQISLVWNPSADDNAVAGYRVERCQGANCTTFTQIATPTGTTYTDTNLTPSTSYTYRVRAQDTSTNLSPYSNTSTATTTSGPDTTPPTVPSGLTASAVSTSRIDLAWTASTDNVAVAEYRVERCSGANCTNFAQVGTSATTAFSSTGLTANTTYRFRVRAADAVPNLSAYSAIAPATTLAPDTTRPSAPTGLSAAATGPTQINLTWNASTDNIGVTGYRVEQCQGSGCTNYVEVAQPTSTTFNTTGLTPSTTYRFRVRAVDAAGNLSTYSSVATQATPALPDTTPPTAPSALAASAAGGGQINLSWSAATDDVSVAQYRVERCQGAGCGNFVQIATSSGTTFADTGLSPSTTYAYRVRAVDPSNNAGPYSNVATATTTSSSPVPPGLVAAYSFDAGSGTTVADVSGNGNTGTLTAATWVAGKYGGGLNFNGTTARVSVPASPSLALTNAMTLAAWIRPTANQNGWRTILQRQPDAYVLNASNSNGPLRPSGGGTLGGSFQWVSGPTASPVNAWTHVAVTYDGSILRLYVNGIQVASKSASGTIENSSSPLWIGGNNPYGEYFNGSIDEARVYNRALSTAEIQAAMNSPLN